MALHVITIPKGFNFTCKRMLNTFIRLHSHSEVMGYEICAWLDDVYFNGGTRTRVFDDTTTF